VIIVDKINVYQNYMDFCWEGRKLAANANFDYLQVKSGMKTGVVGLKIRGHGS